MTERVLCMSCGEAVPRRPGLQPWEAQPFCGSVRCQPLERQHMRRIRADALIDEVQAMRPRRGRREERVTPVDLGLERRVETIRDGRLT